MAVWPEVVKINVLRSFTKHIVMDILMIFSLGSIMYFEVKRFLSVEGAYSCSSFGCLRYEFAAPVFKFFASTTMFVFTCRYFFPQVFPRLPVDYVVRKNNNSTDDFEGINSNPLSDNDNRDHKDNDGDEEEKNLRLTMNIPYPHLSEVATEKRVAPPAQYLFKIESFSQLLEFLSTTGSEKYESRDFEVAGYKWKLSLYPNGDKKRNGSDHISLYLVLSEAKSYPIGTEVNAFFRLFVYDHIQDKYLTVQGASKTQTRFHALKTESGFSQFIPLATFKDACSGYLVNDCCAFGVAVYVTTDSTRRGETILIKKPKKTITHKMERFSKLKDERIRSNSVDIAGHKWSLTVHPNGDSQAKGKNLSMYLNIDSNLGPEQKVWVDYKLRVKNQVGGKHFEFKANSWFSGNKLSWGSSIFLPLSVLKSKFNGYKRKDTVIVEAEVTQVLEAKVCP